MDTRFTRPEGNKLSLEEEELMTSLSEAVEDVENLDQEPIEQAVLGYEAAAGEKERTLYCHSMCATFEDTIRKHPRLLAPHFAKILMKMKMRKIKIKRLSVRNSIVICCRCKTTDVLLDLEKLVASGELNELFSLAMHCLINQQVTASVTISQEEFKKCLVSLTADAG